ncbi:MAG: NHL repeat-containing protein [Candidatus Aquicultorales bacterium]
MIDLSLKISLRKFLFGVLVILVGMILALAYLYYTLNKAPGSQVYRTNELTPLLSIYGRSTKVADLLKRPNDVAFDLEGLVYVADSENGRVFVFDDKGVFVRQIGKKGTGRGELQIPMGVAVGENGDVYVADKILNKVAVFDSKGRAKREIQVAHPMKPWISGDRIYVTTASNVSVYGLDGRKLTAVGKKGKGKGELAYPFGIAVDDGTLYIADLMNLRVQALKQNGDILWVRGEPPKDVYGKNRKFGLPAGLALGIDGYLYVADSFNHQITIMTADGQVLGQVGRQGKGDGELNYPVGIAARKDGVYAIADKYNDRVQLVYISVKEQTRKLTPW